MLTLTRRRGERITVIDKETRQTIGEVVMVGVKGNQARLGFEFGEKYALARNEIIDQICTDSDIDGNR